MKKTQYKQINRKMAMLGLSLVFSAAAFGQSVVVKGNVVDENGEPLVGASVRVKGTNTGATTDVNGNFTLNMKQGSALQVSYIGYNTQTVSVTGQNVSINLVPNDSMLDEAVVIGYGVQKKSVVTAAIAKVTADDLEGKTPVRMDNALKGLAAGVNVTSSSGQPGASPKVRIRGIGSVQSGTDPLYIVDGMPIEGGLDFVNPADIESIEVLKDAASCAIYGARAANGVVLVSTKKGKLGKAQVNYGFSYGWQSAARKRQVTSATDYAILQNEKYVNGGQAPLYQDPYNLYYNVHPLGDIKGDKIEGFGTDWQDLVFNNGAPVQNHEVSISGASDRVNYYLSLGYYKQDGIIGGNYGESNYDRLTIRSNNTYNILNAEAERSFLNRIDVTTNLAYTRVLSTGIGENSEFGSVLGSALYLAPTLPVTMTGAAATAMKKAFEGRDLVCDANGNLYSIPSYIGGYQEMNNPLAMLNVPGNRNWSHKFVTKFGVDLTIWDAIKYHFNGNIDMSFWGNNGATKSLYYLSGNNHREHTEATAYKAQGINWQIENYLSYDKTFGDHTVGVVLGQSAMSTSGSDLSGNRYNLVNPEKPSIDYATGSVVDGNAQFGVRGGVFTAHRIASLFARASYSYADRYMATATVRRDGSSKFGINNKFGVFPSFSLGWNVMNEAFMADTRDWLSNLKIRASWGKNGNDNFENFRYTVLTAMGNNVLIGKVAQKQDGSKANGLANPDLKWEESIQTDLGIDFGFFNNSLTFTADYYIKKTSGMLMVMPIPSYVGESKPWGNCGDMDNKGVELELGYKWNISDAHFHVKGNASYNKNTVNNLGNETGWLEYSIGQGMTGGAIRYADGMPAGFFYGYKTAGVYQTEAEAAAGCTVNGKARHAGDLIFVDFDGDHDITSADRTMIGDGTPKWNFGLNFDFEWKGLDFNIFFQGVAGNDVFDATYRNDVTSGNYPTWMLQRWTGPGTSNTLPKLSLGDTDNWMVSDLYVRDGSFTRLKNISLGYTLPQHLLSKASISKLRVYAMAENLFTWTKYWGFDPEISSGNGYSFGVDKGVYPQARTFTVGVQIGFDGGTISTTDGAAAVATYKPVEKIVERVVEKPVEVVKEVTKEVVKNNNVQSTFVVTFPVNSYNIENTAELDGIAKGSTVEVVAYASPEGKADANMVLSQKRADAVADYLKAHGVNVVRTTAKGADSNHANRIAIVTLK